MSQKKKLKKLHRKEVREKRSKLKVNRFCKHCGSKCRAKTAFCNKFII